MTPFNHITLGVSDLKKSTEFYLNILELPQIEEPFKQGKHSWFHLREHCQLHLVVEKKLKNSHNPQWHFAFTVPDVEAFTKKLEAENILYGGIEDPSKKILLRPDGIKQIYFQDPDGYWIEVNNDTY